MTVHLVAAIVGPFGTAIGAYTCGAALRRKSITMLVLGLVGAIASNTMAVWGIYS